MSEQSDDFKGMMATVDTTGKRQWLYVTLLSGTWRKRRSILAAILISFYMAVPFISINGLPLLRFDIPNRHYIICGQIFWPQDFFYALFFVLMAIVGTLLLVSAFGRLFCGWLCPHTVFLEMVFRPVERLIEGPAHKRRNQDKKRPYSANLILRKILKWFIFCILIGALANTATALFIGTEGFMWGLFVDPVAHPSALGFYIFFFALNYFDFAWLREQTCTIVCPYGRLQSAMLDEDSLTVAYNDKRGEPRGKKGKVEGDCIDCSLCVQVCPTGIDIRNGNQMECLHCAACIDACAGVMDKLGREPNLISYCSERELTGGKWRPIRPRTIMYTCVLLILMTVTTILLINRKTVDVNKLRDDRTAQVITDDNNQRFVLYPLRASLINKNMDEQNVSVAFASSIEGTIVGNTTLTIPPSERLVENYYLRMPAEQFRTVKTPVSIVFSASNEDNSVITVSIPMPRQTTKQSKP